MCLTRIELYHYNSESDSEKCVTNWDSLELIGLSMMIKMMRLYNEWREVEETKHERYTKRLISLDCISLIIIREKLISFTHFRVISKNYHSGYTNCDKQSIVRQLRLIWFKLNSSWSLQSIVSITTLSIALVKLRKQKKSKAKRNWEFLSVIYGSIVWL